VTALGATLNVRLLWQGEALDRLLDAGHAELVERAIAILASPDWEIATEVSFNVRGERGSIDILAFHRASGALLVIEVKSAVPDMQAMLFGLDRKGRIASDLARERGWAVTSVSRLLVLPDDRTARRRVAAHAATFRVALPARTVEVKRWLKAPIPMAGILFVPDVLQATARHRLGAGHAEITARRDQTERG
jgi:hypothetical protein